MAPAADSVMEVVMERSLNCLSTARSPTGACVPHSPPLPLLWGWEQGSYPSCYPLPRHVGDALFES